MKVYFRDDDVLLPSSSWADPLGRFKQLHLWFEESKHCLHVPTILVTEIQQFPQAVEFIKTETEKNKMFPQLHGIQHIDYAKLSIEEVKDHLNRGREWMLDNLNVNPNRWYTPWGANAPHLYEAASETGYELVDCSNIIKSAHVIQAFRKNYPIDYFDKKEIFFHWWEGGSRVKRIIDTIERGHFIDE